MRLSDFETLVRALSAEVPPEFLDGIAEVAGSPRTVPHPDREGIWTLGECVPIAGDDGDPRHLQSRVVLYHGSFQALARGTDGFDRGGGGGGEPPPQERPPPGRGEAPGPRPGGVRGARGENPPPPGRRPVRSRL